MARSTRHPGETERRAPGAPKGRPTPGRRQRHAEARARARRRRLVVRAWWIGGTLVFVGALVALIVTDAGAATGPLIG